MLKRLKNALALAMGLNNVLSNTQGAFVPRNRKQRRTGRVF